MKANLVELMVFIDIWELPIPGMITGIVLALLHLNKSKPNHNVRLEKLKGGGRVKLTSTIIPDNWGFLFKLTHPVGHTRTVLMSKAWSKGAQTHFTIRVSSNKDFIDNDDLANWRHILAPHNTIYRPLIPGFNKRGLLVYRGWIIWVTRPFAAVLVTDYAPWR